MPSVDAEIVTRSESDPQGRAPTVAAVFATPAASCKASG